MTIGYLNGPASTLTAAIHLLEQVWSSRWGTLLQFRPLDELPAVVEQRATSPVNKVVIDVAGSRLRKQPPRRDQGANVKSGRYKSDLLRS